MKAFFSDHRPLPLPPRHPFPGGKYARLRMRLLGDEAVIFGKLGVAAVATPSPEIYEAMQRGVIDGFQHQNIGGDIRMGFQEIVDYVYMSPARQPTDMYILYVNKDAWAELPDDLKKILTEVG